MALFGLVGMGLGLILSGLNVFFRDTVQFLAVVMQVLFWFNPIVYFKDIVFGDHPDHPLMLLERLGRVLLVLNPFERFISANQWLFGYELGQHAPGRIDWLIIILFPAVCLLAGRRLFRRMLSDIRDCL